MGSKSVCLPNERDEHDLKVEKMQNSPYFSYFLEKFILQMSCLIAITCQSVKNLWVPEPFSKFQGNQGTHANASTEYDITVKYANESYCGKISPVL